MTDEEIQEDIDRLLSHDRLSWLFGAGSSFSSGLPLMDGLTARVLSILQDSAANIVNEAGEVIPEADFCSAILAQIGPHATIEQLLDHLSDYLAIAVRSQNRCVTTSDGSFRNDRLAAVRLNILAGIRATVGFGYRHDAVPANCQVGTLEAPIVQIDQHLEFIRALFGEVRAGRPRTQCVDLFTLNYDTLFEDALALSGLPYSDGFVGGAIAYWDPAQFSSDANCVRLVKLHGSIDWANYRHERIVRRRIIDRYPDAGSDLLIYPQASKYEFARREPFDTLFQRFRNRISGSDGQVLAVCGYGFGDAHVNLEIENAMAQPNSGLTLVVFAKSIADALHKWQRMSFGERMYVLTEGGVYRGSNLFCAPAPGAAAHDWWTFVGMTRRLRNLRLASGTI